MSGAEGRPRLFVHIGTHKTGTTSLQHWLQEHEGELRSRFALGVYRGAFPNCREVGLACASTDRRLPTRGIPQWVDPEWRRHVGDLVAEQLGRDENLILSSEALSFLRSPEEVGRLAGLVRDRDVTIIVVLRNRADFLRSWAGHLQRDRYRLSDDPTSFAYVEPDSWLVDYDALLGAYRDTFGHERVSVIDYDTAMAHDGSVIPSVMREVVGGGTPIPEWRTARRNVGADVAESRLLAKEHPMKRLARFLKHPVATSRRVVRRRRQDAAY